jgi:hypothetical protein
MKKTKEDLDRVIVKEDVHKCLNGKTFEYKVTKQDVLRREFTGDSELYGRIISGDINPIEVSRLLNELYG